VGQAPVQGSEPGRQARANRQIRTKGNTLGAVAKRDVSALLAQINPITRTKICRPLVPRAYVRSVILSEIAYGPPLELIIDLIRSI
jgi:hypothetical protein